MRKIFYCFILLIVIYSFTSCEKEVNEEVIKKNDSKSNEATISENSEKIVYTKFGVLEDEFLYFSDNGIYKTNSSDITKKIKVIDEIANEIDVLNNFIYYTSMDSLIYKIKSDGSEKTKINNESSKNLNVYENNIYYTHERKIQKIDLNGNNKTTLDSEENSLFSIIDIVDKIIYYQLNNDLSTIYTMNIDGSNKTSFSIDKCYEIKILDNWIYYINANDFQKLYKIKINGESKTKITNVSTDILILVDNFIYYQDTKNDHELYKIDINSLKTAKITDDWCDNIVITENYIYYTNINNNQRYIVNLNTLEKTKQEYK
ncbi:MAG: DUF5050 domain-containing protein [Clostridiales bacterium]